MKTTMNCLVCGETFTRYHTAKQTPKHCSRACSNKAPGRITPEIRSRMGSKGERNPNWISGQWSDPKGRVFIRVPLEERHLHPTVRPDGYLLRAHYVWNTAHPEDVVPRGKGGEIVHHKDDDRTNDSLENLEKITQAEHARIHGLRQRKIYGRKPSEETREKMRQAQRARRQRERDSAEDH